VYSWKLWWMMWLYDVSWDLLNSCLFFYKCHRSILTRVAGHITQSAHYCRHLTANVFQKNVPQLGTCKPLLTAEDVGKVGPCSFVCDSVERKCPQMEFKSQNDGQTEMFCFCFWRLCNLFMLCTLLFLLLFQFIPYKVAWIKHYII